MAPRLELALVLTACALVLAGCILPTRTLVLDGDAKSVRISYSNEDIAAAQRAATDYCAQFDRAARYADASPDIAYYDCVAR